MKKKNVRIRLKNRMGGFSKSHAYVLQITCMQFKIKITT
ncbi:hypothetical protein M2459_002150 [Parabacteroides sp. PF5-5]|nr:hypothetical protein [Parabacteroides sp. PF5-13]MDH6319762.1 hypothetical protein [Parabacteroides sp. PH5-13]MDH6327466.1 hypothetical protein [Parabacteroides sp. PH5-41]MDH6335394.1 hypothetical protein [Parabacteroides sp. PF5-5]MDH6346457.1 hypothetical protein [Parabacteroides sp. PH5-46]MDH6361292.1 hypothetical protein [Parabacteroides sp. PH5-16]MDH6376959.1 hypothetical protein [Parabacteroides sp. PH5-33]MDH6407225.1 hypothetical protein [Parabacteroides sp. PH5-26]